MSAPRALGDHLDVPRAIVTRLLTVAAAATLAGWGAPSALAAWRLDSITNTSIAYNQGVTFDRAGRSYFFDGVSSATNSGLYRTGPSLSQQAARYFELPATAEGYNHTGDLSFDPIGRRVVLPLECYYPGAGGNTCGSGAIGIADPVSLAFRYYVSLDRSQIQKAMWAEIDPAGRWIWTSSDTHLLAYRARDVTQATAAGQRAGTVGAISGTDLGAVLPTGSVTGAAFYPAKRPGRLFLSLNRGTSFEVVSFRVRSAPDGSPTLADATPRHEVTVARSFDNDEPEGLAVSGGVLHWQMLPAIRLYSRLLDFTPDVSTAAAQH